MGILIDVVIQVNKFILFFCRNVFVVAVIHPPHSDHLQLNILAASE